jgi:hypothetical protein
MTTDNVENRFDAENRMRNEFTWTEWLEKFDEFEKTYPKDKDVLEGPEWDWLSERRPDLDNYDLPETLTNESLDELFKVLDWGDSDAETAHSLEKEAMNKFICGLAGGKYTPEETQAMAKKFMEIGRIPFARWFA